MSNNQEHTLFHADQDSADFQRATATPARKTWVTPKVITSMLREDTASTGTAGHDAASPS